MVQSMRILARTNYILGIIIVLCNRELQTALLIFVTLAFIQSFFPNNGPQSLDFIRPAEMVKLSSEQPEGIGEHFQEPIIVASSSFSAKTPDNDECHDVHETEPSATAKEYPSLSEAVSLSMDKGNPKPQSRASFSSTGSESVLPLLLEPLEGGADKSHGPATNLDKSWVFVEALFKAVKEFKAACRAGNHPPGFAEYIHPNYEGMLRRFYKTYEPSKMAKIGSYLEEYKQNEQALFRKLSKKYKAPNYLLQFRSPMDTSSDPFSDSAGAPAGQNVTRLTALDLDKMVPLLERVLNAQERFRNEGKPCHIDIGFHYTDPTSLRRIEVDGLLNQEERGIYRISSHFHGAKYGEGIYTADPQAYQNYGSVGLLVARLKGVQLDYETADSGYSKGNTCLTHKRIRSLVVLEKRFQVVPLVQYPMELFATNDEGLSYLNALSCKIQGLLDVHFNDEGPRWDHTIDIETIW